MRFGIRSLGRYRLAVSRHIPLHLPVPWVRGGLQTAAPDISIGVATAQSACDLCPGIESLSDPFLLHGGGEGLLLCM